LTTFLIILIIAAILFFLFWYKKAEKKSTVLNERVDKPNELIIAEELEGDQIFYDDYGAFKKVKKIREIPRKTYIIATIHNGKYWGEIDENYSSQFENSKYFEFNVYEITLLDAKYSFNPFELEHDIKIPRDKLPKYLPSFLEENGKSYEINLFEPIFGQVKHHRKLHQVEGNEVFGTFDAVVTGYILDFRKEIYWENEYLGKQNDIPNPSPLNIPTGNVENKGNYKRIELYGTNYQKTYWGDWVYVKPANTTFFEGCLSTGIGGLAGIISIIFLILILPQLLILLPLLVIPLLLNVIPSRFFNWIIKLGGVLLLFAFFANLFQFFNHGSTWSILPKPKIVEQIEEQKTQTEPICDTLNNQAINDTLIKHFRVWKDYDGNQYEGTIWTKKSDFENSRYFKNNLSIDPNSSNAYDEVIFSLKENDKDKLNGVYQLFDSIQQKRPLSPEKFSELIVSFIQDIPYTIIVTDACNSRLYEDKFIKEYLSSEDARCDGFEKFGINSPVEFMSNLNGDCDSRTLLLYTIFAHYGFDVAILSSEYYGHSIIGLNLPISGLAYQYQNKRYVLWETTAPNCKAGVLPKEISNLNYWRISLKSK